MQKRQLSETTSQGPSSGHSCLLRGKCQWRSESWPVWRRNIRPMGYCGGNGIFPSCGIAARFIISNLVVSETRSSFCNGHGDLHRHLVGKLAGQPDDGSFLVMDAETAETVAHIAFGFPQ